MAYKPPKQTIVDNDLKYAPSNEAVFEALKLKLDEPSVAGTAGQLLQLDSYVGGEPTMSWVNPGANTSLSNLVGPTAINASLLFNPDNTYDIGADGASRPAGIHAASHVTSPVIRARDNVTVAGQHDITVRAGNGITGNKDGGNLTIASGTASGTGTAGSIIINTAGVERLRVTDSGETRFAGSISGYVGISSAASTTSYSLVLPSAQGGVNTFLNNDGAGNLNWSVVDLTTLANKSLSNLTSPTAINQVLRGQDGTVTAPAFSFINDTNTGWWNAASDTLAASTNGLERIRITDFGNVIIGTSLVGSTGITISPSFNISWPQSANESIPNIFRQHTSAGTVIANGYQYLNSAGGFASSLSTSWAKSAIVLGPQGGAGAITFYTNTAAAVAAGNAITPTERMRITSAGNIGIGTSSPQNILNVSGALPQLRLDGTGNTGFFLYDSNVWSGGMYTDAGQVRVIATTGRDLMLLAGSSNGSNGEVIRCTTAGRVGIGTTTPSEKLEVANGNIKASGTLSLVNNDIIVNSYGLIINSNAVFKGALQFVTDNMRLSASTGFGIRFTTDSANGDVNERMRITSAGDVGIGTTTPAQKLDVSGTIQGTAVKVPNYILSPQLYDAGTKAANFSLDLGANGPCQQATINAAGPLVLTLSNPVTGGAYLLKIVQGATPGTITWPGNVKWGAAGAPTLSAVTGKIDIINLYYDGTNYYGTYALGY